MMAYVHLARSLAGLPSIFFIFLHQFNSISLTFAFSYRWKRLFRFYCSSLSGLMNTFCSIWQCFLFHCHTSYMKIICITLFVVPTDAHYYKIREMLKQLTIITLAPTCFGSRRNHHQGAVLCLAKTTNMRRSQCYGGISSCCAVCPANRTPAQQADMPP